MYRLNAAKLQNFPIVLLMLTIAGCTPSYKTAYLYSLPQDEKQAVCFSICDKHRSRCLQHVQTEKRNCELRNQMAHMAYRQCLSVNRSGPGATSPVCDDNQNFCFSDPERCEANYRKCFMDCGGEISEDSVCITHCPD